MLTLILVFALCALFVVEACLLIVAATKHYFDNQSNFEMSLCIACFAAGGTFGPIIVRALFPMAIIVEPNILLIILNCILVVAIGFAIYGFAVERKYDMDCSYMRVLDYVMNPKDVKKCPFCKNRQYLDVVYRPVSKTDVVCEMECRECGMKFSGLKGHVDYATSADEIISRWNDRG